MHHGVCAVQHACGATVNAEERLERIRAVLAAFDWEFDDRQYALEAIDRIANEDDQ